MAPTLRRVVAMAPLRLRVLAAAGELDRPVRWVAVSELEDPTPYLEGGELVLTTGMRLGAYDAGPYISRLVARGAAGLGFGVGLSHEEVPEEYVRAAEARGLPLIEVHRDTPFIAVGKAVSELLAAEQYEELNRAFAAQGRLTRAALQPEGMHAVVDRLAKEVDGWVLLLDEGGGVLHSAGAGARRRARGLLPELERLRATGAPAGLSSATPDEHLIVQRLGDHRRLRGFLAVGRARPFSPVAHTVVNAAGSLLTLALEQSRARFAAEARVRTAALRLLLAGDRAAAEEVLGEGLPTGPVVVFACRSDDAEGLGDALPGFTAPWRGMVVALVPEAQAQRAAAIAAERGRAGSSDPVALDALAAGLRQAERALERAHTTGKALVRFRDLAGQGLLALLDPEAAAGYAEALLAPLREHGSRADLIESLRAYLAANGHWDAAAQRLGVHRHTLRYRIRKAAELLGRDLDDPATRAELWVALNVGTA
ncbi:PucR family transcriptional regulator [Thermopolyspora flexuosa]|uniref:Purine catabolism regulator n=1 Tax=Thermopolyspora flexuosa TaxID=103836 RepID=A0A543J0Y1_9ACTN|nr:PucR family transcriptional regulator [Thermopolyspora flexuosa]TQM76485.1 purine catabolism regulator [Thermopolyspora flexuosa]